MLIKYNKDVQICVDYEQIALDQSQLWAKGLQSAIWIFMYLGCCAYALELIN